MVVEKFEKKLLKRSGNSLWYVEKGALDFLPRLLACAAAFKATVLYTLINEPCALQSII